MIRRRPVEWLSVVLALSAAWAACRPPSQPPVLECTCRQLADSPVTYAGKTVRVDTEGTQRIDARKLGWRRLASESPVVVLVFDQAIPSPIPETVTGSCHAPLAGGPVRVVGCE